MQYLTDTGLEILALRHAIAILREKMAREITTTAQSAEIMRDIARLRQMANERELELGEIEQCVISAI